MASFSYTYTDDYNHTTANPAKVTVSYTATYDPTNNCTTVKINSVKHNYWRSSNGGSSWYCSVTVTALDSSYKAKTIGCFQQGSGSDTSTDSTAEFVVDTLTVQHSEEAGDKKINIKCTTRLNYLISTTALNCTNRQESGNKDVTVATGQPAFTYTNEMFANRNYVLAAPDYRPDSSNIMGITIPYTSSYNPLTNKTILKFSQPTLQHSQVGVYLEGSIKITITPVGNEEGAKIITLNVPKKELTDRQTIGSYSAELSYSSSEVIVQHTSTEYSAREVEVYMEPNVTHCLTTSGSSTWTFDNDETNTFISGIYGTQGLIYIDNGTEFVAYQVYIDNGTGWDLYVPCIDNGTDWEYCN